MACLPSLQPLLVSGQLAKVEAIAVLPALSSSPLDPHPAPPTLPQPLCRLTRDSPRAVPGCTCPAGGFRPRKSPCRGWVRSHQDRALEPGSVSLARLPVCLVQEIRHSAQCARRGGGMVQRAADQRARPQAGPPEASPAVRAAATLRGGGERRRWRVPGSPWAEASRAVTGRFPSRVPSHPPSSVLLGEPRLVSRLFSTRDN